MKDKFFQLYLYFNTIDRRYVQWAYFVFALGMLIVRGTSEDSGGGTR
jgi:hypothetical protein